MPVGRRPLPLLLALAALTTPALGQDQPAARARPHAAASRPTKAEPAAKRVVFDAKPQLAAYALVAHDSYAAAVERAERLRAAVNAFLDQPNDTTLFVARSAWMNARPAWLQTLAFRFSGSPVDTAPPKSKVTFAEALDAWPIDEPYLDSVENNPTAGLVNDMNTPLTRETLRAKHQATTRIQVTTGFHAIEFILWGQDTSPAGPGNRAFTDFTPNQPNNERRRSYLKLAVDLLIEDLQALEIAWNPKGTSNYAARFRSLPQRDAIDRVFTGLSTVVDDEIAGRMIQKPLDTGDAHDMSACCSDSADVDFVFALRGIRNVWFGDYGPAARAGWVDLVQKLDPQTATLVTNALNRAEAAVAAIDHPFDRVLASPSGSPARKDAEDAVAALHDLAKALRDAAAVMGVEIKPQR